MMIDVCYPQGGGKWIPPGYIAKSERGKCGKQKMQKMRGPSILSYYNFMLYNYIIYVFYNCEAKVAKVALQSVSISELDEGRSGGWAPLLRRKIEGALLHKVVEMAKKHLGVTSRATIFDTMEFGRTWANCIVSCFLSIALCSCFFIMLLYVVIVCWLLFVALHFL